MLFVWMVDSFVSFALTVGSDGQAATASVVWSFNGQTYTFRSDNNFLSWITTIFTVADVLSTSEFVVEGTSIWPNPKNLVLAATGQSIPVVNNTILSGICTISGIKIDGSETALYQRSIQIKNIGGVVSLVHVSTISTDHEDDPAFGITITASGAPPSLIIECSGGVGDTIKWKAVFRGLQIEIP